MIKISDAEGKCRYRLPGTKADYKIINLSDETVSDVNENETVPIPEGHRNVDESQHPNYYFGTNKDGKAIEVFDIIDQFVDGDFYLGNVLKYVCRAGKKSKETKLLDLEKAAHYIKEAIKRCGGE